MERKRAGGSPTNGGTMRRPGAAWRVDPVLLALGVLALLTTVGYGAQLGSTVTQVVVCWVLMAVLHLTLAVCAWRVARVPGHRRMWRIAAFAGATYLAGDLIQLVAIARAPYDLASATGTDAQTVSVAVGTVALLGAMLTSPLGIESKAARSRFWLDIATVMVAAATFGSYAIALPSGEHPARWAAEAAVTVLSGPGVFLVGVFAVVKLILGGRPPFTLAAGTCCGAAAALQTVLQGSGPSGTGPGELSLVLGVNIVASTLLTAGARVQQLQMRSDPEQRRRHQRPTYSRLPYAAIAATYLLLVWSLATQGLSGHAWVVLGGAILSTSLVVGRQLAAFRDIAELLAERDALAARLTAMAFHDSLTGLANRALFMQRLTAALASSAPVAVALVDLDEFKPVNDQHGHATGDELLRRVGGWLTAAVRDGDTVARLGGDEFAVLLTDLPAGERDTLAGRLSAALHRRTRIGSVDVTARGSVGVVFAEPGTRTPDELLHGADLAMYAAKRRTTTSRMQLSA
jgi:diguanylate cyclase (GGDEF)-like protein